MDEDKLLNLKYLDILAEIEKKTKKLLPKDEGKKREICIIHSLQQYFTGRFGRAKARV